VKSWVDVAQDASDDFFAEPESFCSCLVLFLPIVKLSCLVWLLRYPLPNLEPRYQGLRILEKPRAGVLLAL
jgi:hypothetical protein